MHFIKNKTDVRIINECIALLRVQSRSQMLACVGGGDARNPPGSQGGGSLENFRNRCST